MKKRLWFLSAGLAIAWLCPAASLAQDAEGEGPSAQPTVAVESNTAADLRIKEAAEIYTSDQSQESARKAAAAFEDVVAKYPESLGARSWLGYLYVILDEPQRAIPHLEAADRLATRENKMDTEVRTNLGAAYMKAQQYDKAAGIYQDLANRQPNLAIFWYNLGGFNLERKQYEAASAAYEKALAITGSEAAPAAALDAPSRALAQNNLGRVYERMNRPREASEHYLEAVRLEPENALYNRNAGVALFNAKKDAEALPYLEKSIRNKPDDEKLALVAAEAYMRLGREQEALELLEPMQSRFERNAAYWYNLGVLRAKSGNMESAEQAYEKAEQIDGNDKDTLNNLALIYYKRGSYQEAERRFRKLATAEPNNTIYKLNLAATLVKTNKVAEAVELWRQFIRANPTRTDVRLNLADGLWSLGDRQMARFHYNEVLKTEPNNAIALNGMGLWQLWDNKQDLAEKAFRKAIEQDPKYMPPYANLAVTLERVNKRAEAIATLKKALAIDPEFDDGRQLLDRLEKAA